MKKLILATMLLTGALASEASAANVITFAETNTSGIIATNDAGNTTTTISATDQPIIIGQFEGGSAPSSLLSLTATSIDAAITVGSAIIQHYAGSFCITTAAGCTGVNVLSGTFTDAAFGAGGGPGLVVNVNNPPDVLNLTSDLLTPDQLLSPSALNFGFTDLSPVLAIIGTTIQGFTATFSGNASATVANVPEPGTLALLGVGLLGLGLVTKRRNA